MRRLAYSALSNQIQMIHISDNQKLNSAWLANVGVLRHCFKAKLEDLESQKIIVNGLKETKAEVIIYVYSSCKIMNIIGY